MTALNNDTHIIVTWEVPTTPNGRVNYTVKVEDRDLLTGDVIIIHTEVVTETKLTVQYQVEAYSMYNISVTSKTSIGMADAVTDSFTTPEKGSDFILRWLIQLTDQLISVFLILFPPPPSISCTHSNSSQCSYQCHSDRDCLNLCCLPMGSPRVSQRSDPTIHLDFE